jgi:Flp pilus assembly protein TadG
MVNVMKRKENRCRGAAAVEAALVLPVLLLVTFGAIRYGWFFLKAQEVTNAARYGARVAIRADASTQDVLDAISALLGPHGSKIIDNNDVSPYVTFMVNDGPSANVESASNMGDSVTVTVTIPAADVDIMPLVPFTNLDPSNFNISASFTMCKEGS